MREEQLKIDERAKKYMASTEKVLKEIKIMDKLSVSEVEIQMVINSARDYHNDSRHYFEKKDYTTALAAITYCEGLLDALRHLGLVGFTW
jgi:FAD synthetase